MFKGKPPNHAMTQLILARPKIELQRLGFADENSTSQIISSFLLDRTKFCSNTGPGYVSHPGKDTPPVDRL